MSAPQMPSRHHAGRDRSPRSSSAELSSPPRSSPDDPAPVDGPFAHDLSHQSSITVNPSAAAAAQLPARRKPGRKPKISLNPDGSSATNTDAPKPKRTRRPRDVNAPPVQRRRKNQSLESADGQVVAASTTDDQPRPQIADSEPTSGESSFNVRPDSGPAQNGKREDIPSHRPIHSFFTAPPPPPPQPQPQPQPQAQQQPPQQLQHQHHPHHHQPHQHQPPPLPLQQQAFRTSGQNYDPIRSNYDPVRETVIGHHSPYSTNSQGSPIHPPALNRASASPSISSLVDPPNQALASPSVATQSFFNQQQQARHRDENRPPVPLSPPVNRPAPPLVLESSLAPRPPTPVALAPTPPSQSSTSKKTGTTGSPASATTELPNPSAPSVTTKKTMTGDASSTNAGQSSIKKTMGNGSATTSAAASPKPLPKLKDSKDIYPTPPPLPGAMGAGLTDGTEFRAPTVVLNIPLAGETNKYINFTRLAEEQYGWDALHPRLAAQRDRLARVAAAGAALERNGSNKESGDEMSLDSEGEGSNVDMGGMSDGRTGTDGGAKKIPRKRRMKEDEYDKEDGFVDDSELLWEEQAAAANDGFFVYSGPLVPEVPKPAVELRADGAPKRARGRGSRGGATRSASTRGGSSLGGPGSRGGAATGPGSRGGSTTRKPRITKADRARMEMEKAEREKMGNLSSLPGNYGGMPQLASAASMGNTPMVFNQ